MREILKWRAKTFVLWIYLESAENRSKKLRILKSSLCFANADAEICDFFNSIFPKKRRRIKENIAQEFHSTFDGPCNKRVRKRSADEAQNHYERWQALTQNASGMAKVGPLWLIWLQCRCYCFFFNWDATAASPYSLCECIRYDNFHSYFCCCYISLFTYFSRAQRKEECYCHSRWRIFNLGVFRWKSTRQTKKRPASTMKCFVEPH